FVVDVGNVDHPVYVVTAIPEVPGNGVEDDRSHHVADMGFRVHRRSAEVDTDSPALDRAKGLLSLRERVVNVKCRVRIGREGHGDRKGGRTYGRPPRGQRDAP